MKVNAIQNMHNKLIVCSDLMYIKDWRKLKVELLTLRRQIS